MPFSSYFLDTYVAPELSKLGHPSPPRLSELEPAWVNRFIMTSGFVVGVTEPHRAYLMHLFRRGEGAIEAYHEACAALLTFLSRPANEGTISPYFRALRYFETCITQTYQAYLTLGKLNGANLFDAGDHSALDRLLSLYNVAKHADDRIELGEVPSNGGSLAVRLSEEGLRSPKATLSYHELASLLSGLAGRCTRALDSLANVSLNQDADLV